MQLGQGDEKFMQTCSRKPRKQENQVENTFKADLTLKCMDWTQVAQTKVQWRACREYTFRERWDIF